MKTIYITDNGRVGLDIENNTAFPVIGDREAIRSIKLIEEETDIVVIRNNHNYTLRAHPGQILIDTWDTDFTKPAFLVDSESWADNIRNYNKKVKEFAETNDAECAKAA